MNKITQIIEDNPKSRNQIELKKQFFAFYVMDERILYLSQISNKEMLQEYIADVLQIETLIKNVYSSIDEFVDAIEYLESAEFVEHRRITQDEVGARITQACTDIYGLGCPERINIKLDLMTKTGKALKNIIHRLNQRFQQDAVKSIVLVGKDDQNIAYHFNLSSDVLTVVSIMLGFYFTALAVQIGNKMTVRMSHISDVEYPTVSQLEVLMKYFKFVFLSGFGGILLILFAGIVPENIIQRYSAIWQMFEAFVAGVIAVALAASFVIFHMLINSIVEEAVRLYRQEQQNNTN